jgi:hypothetical protein
LTKSKNNVILKLPTTSTVHSFVDYQHSQKVVKDFPKVLDALYKTLTKLAPYQAYGAVYEVTRHIEDAVGLIELQEALYTEIHQQKGKIRK